ncbi:MAG: glycoside hydrolase family 28 protein [Polaromonas sp.]|nr:glycoside hydrolase family 28 protein [Polaromonas sp.]
MIFKTTSLPLKRAASTAEVALPTAPGRRTFLAQASCAVLGGSLMTQLVGCGGGDSAELGEVDAIWGSNGAAERIMQSLASVSQAMFAGTDYNVVDFGAVACTVMAASSPYTDLAKSPLSVGADMTQAPGSFDSRPAFLAAIKACSSKGGGRVVVPTGNWYCAGPIVLLSNVNFHLSKNCTIYFSPVPDDYAKDGPVDCGANGKLYYTRWQSNDCLNFGSPIYAYQQDNIAITGEDESSILNGQAMTPFAGSGNTSTCWWTYKGNTGVYGAVDASTTPSCAWPNPLNVDLKVKAPGVSDALYTLLIKPITPWQQDQNYLPALSEMGVPVSERIFGLGHYLRPCMVEFIGCTNVLMENYQTRNTPFWQHHPVGCKNVVIRNVLVESVGPNNDGFDPDGCDTVLCEKMVFNTGDDCIAIKSGKNLDTQYGASRDILIQDCTMNSGHGGLTLGSEMGAGIERVYARNLMMLNKHWDTDPLNIAIRIKTNMNRGGYVKDLYVNGVSLPNGVSLSGKGYGSSMLTGSPINANVPIGVATKNDSNPSASQGGIITFDCDYQPAKDAIRTRPALVQNVNISNVKVGNVSLNGQSASCFQAIVAQGPVAFDYNGALPVPSVPAITDVRITDCDFGTPAAAKSIYAYNVNAITLTNVKIAGAMADGTVSDIR